MLPRFQSKSLKTHQINLFTFYKIKFTIYTKTSTKFFFLLKIIKHVNNRRKLDGVFWVLFFSCVCWKPGAKLCGWHTVFHLNIHASQIPLLFINLFKKNYLIVLCKMEECKVFAKSVHHSTCAFLGGTVNEKSRT
jgi:hypothetical protein